MKEFSLETNVKKSNCIQPHKNLPRHSIPVSILCEEYIFLLHCKLMEKAARLKELFQPGESTKERLARCREECLSVFSRPSQKIALIIGPCSISHRDSFLGYLEMLYPLRREMNRGAKWNKALQ